MKICLLSSRFPWPERGGDYIRTNRVAQYLKSQGHQVILVCLNEGFEDSSHINGIYDKIFTIQRKNLATLFHSAIFALKRKPIQCGFYYSYAFKKLFHQVIEDEKPDLYICWLLRMSPYIEGEHLESKTIMEMSDALSKTYTLSQRAKGSLVKRFIYNLERTPIFRYEQKVIHSYPKVVLVAQPDIDYLKANTPPPADCLKLHTIGIDRMKERPTSYDTNKICFIGNMRTLQNQDAVNHFVKDIFPLILEKAPQTKFYIVGAEPPQSIQNLGKHPNIIVTGFVEDIHSAFSDSCLAVAPVQVAAGIQNKVLMAMGAGVPVVLSPLISKAIPQLSDGKNCFIRDNAQEFADCCLQLLQNAHLRNSISSQCFDLVKEHYSWEEKLKGYEQI